MAVVRIYANKICVFGEYCRYHFRKWADIKLLFKIETVKYIFCLL